MQEHCHQSESGGKISALVRILKCFLNLKDGMSRNI
jgi:hypothetical protein